MIRNRNMDLLRNTLWVPWQGFTGMRQKSGAFTEYQSRGTGNRESLVLDNTEIAGLAMQTAALAVDPSHYVEHLMMFGLDFPVDPSEELGVRAVFAHDDTSGDLDEAAEWKLVYGLLRGNVTDLSVNPATLLNTPIPNLLVTKSVAADQPILCVTARGIIDGKVIPETSLGLYLRLSLNSAANMGGNNIWLLGLLFDFMPRFTKGYNQRSPALLANPLAES